FSSRRRHQVIYEPIIHRQVRLRLYKIYSIHRAGCRTGKERCAHAAHGRAFSTDYVHLVNLKKMKKLYPSGQAMPTRTGPSEPTQSSHDTSHERMTIKKERPVAASDGKVEGWVDKTLSTSMDHTSSSSTLFLLSTIFVLLNFCFISATHAQSQTHHSGGGAAEVVKGLQIGLEVPEQFWTYNSLFFFESDTIRQDL